MVFSNENKNNFSGYVGNLTNCEREDWKNICISKGFELMIFAIRVHCSTNWAMKLQLLKVAVSINGQSMPLKSVQRLKLHCGYNWYSVKRCDKIREKLLCLTSNFSFKYTTFMEQSR